MFKPFFKEERFFCQEPFIDYEVQFNVFYFIIEGKELIALKTSDNNAIAIQNPGYAMWLWINETLEKSTIDTIINSLCSQLKDNKLSAISGKPEFVKIFAEKYSKILGVPNKIALSMESYQCPKVIKPKNVQGKLIKAKLSNADIVTEFLVGFSFDCFGVQAIKEKQIPIVESMIKSGNLYLWEVDNKICGMVNIAHRSKRYARINCVYTSPEQRKRGYASAMVAELSSILIKEGLTPMLYADIKNSNSNKVYKTIGFIESGRIDNIIFI
ncbi:GNAT family N-acetyltransferase [Clostridium sp.]|uniref:GNAT family N-acetyltransferase n=1 Tax=Clostridium sp. TaxID=1506 RepID=UPI00284CC52D|nr:GNAT family N-acetyltransferase [Clostridium sp.]MDR3594488.1 GNAT family N-acetyltransferase [Clostridium sp.]